jgi:N-acetylmuramoyl-L-alanine amidase
MSCGHTRGGFKNINCKDLPSAMASRFFGRETLRDRRRILRGVYEENLALLGSGRLPPARRKPLRVNRILSVPIACLFALVIYGQYRGSPALPKSPPPEKQGLSAPAQPPPPLKPITNSVSASEPAPPRNETPSELKVLEKGGNIPLSRMLGLGVRRIVIDAGHGGSDTGTVGKMGTREKDITLDIAARLQANLAENGFSQVQMTREDDSAVTLQDRVTFAREANADLFVSIHVNSLPGTPINAVETYYFGPSRDPAALKVAAQENTGSEYGLSDFEKILEKLGKTMKLQESRKLAEAIQSNLFLNSSKLNQNIQNNGVKRAPFVVLLGLDVPSVIAEVSCLSNAEEERELNSETHRENLASYLAAGILSYAKGAKKNDTTR